MCLSLALCVCLWAVCLVRRAHGVCLYFGVFFLLLYAMLLSSLANSRKKEKKAYISSPLAGIFLVISMALSSVFRRINVKDLTSKVSVYTSATGDDFGSLP